MPTITIPLDLSRGPVFPIRIKTAGSDSTIKTYAVLSISSYDCQLSPGIARRLNGHTLGHSKSYTYLGEPMESPTHQVSAEVITGGLGRPIYRTLLPTIYAAVTDLPEHIGLVIGLQVLHKGLLICDRQGFSFCI